MGSRFDHRFTLDVAGDHECTSVVVRGDLDRASAPDLTAGLRRLLGESRVVVDISAASLVDSAALGALVRLHQAFEKRGGRFEILTGPGYQKVLFDTAGLTGYLHLRAAT